MHIQQSSIIYSFPPLLQIHLFFHDIYNWVKVAYSFLIILHVFGMPLTSWPWYVTLYQIIFYLPTVSLIFIQDIVSLYLSTWCSGKVLIHVVEDLGIVIPKAKQPWQKDIKTKLQHMNQYLTKLANELYVYCFDKCLFFFFPLSRKNHVKWRWNIASR